MEPFTIYLPFCQQVVEIDSNSAMVTFAQKGGESHSREVAHAQFEATFLSYTTSKAGEAADPANVQVCVFFFRSTRTQW